MQRIKRVRCHDTKQIFALQCSHFHYISGTVLYIATLSLQSNGALSATGRSKKLAVKKRKNCCNMRELHATKWKREHHMKPKKECSTAAKQSEGIAMRCKNKENHNANERLCIAALFVFAMHCDTLTFAMWCSVVASHHNALWSYQQKLLHCKMKEIASQCKAATLHSSQRAPQSAAPDSAATCKERVLWCNWKMKSIMI